ncbi:hypothetical protein E4T39_04096 [Aureobasidium subglaciale]|nr:hypothetical protein E4T39_04096 [Aureobasidium subglaciale]
MSISSQHITTIVDSKPQGLLGTFIPGQTISGKVVYNPPTQVDIDQVVIICKGTCYTKITERHGNNTSHYREKITLFRDQDTIFRGPHTISSGRYEWPFRFELPIGTDYLRKERSKDHLFQLGSQGLPPTFNFYSAGFSTPPEAKITYQLKVKINPGRVLRTTQSRLELPLWPISPTPLRAPLPLDGPCNGDGRFKSKALRPAQHTFKEKMSHVFGSDPALKTPEINIAVSFKMPRCVSAAQAMPLSVSCKYTRRGQNDPEAPELAFDSCQFILKAHVDARAKGTIGDHYKNGKSTVIDHCMPGNKMLLPLDGSWVPISDSVRLADMTKRVPHHLAPTFKTFTVAMSYKMAVKVRIRHLQLGRVWQLESKFPFEILPGEVEVPVYTQQQQAASSEAGPSALYPPQLQAGNEIPSSSAVLPGYEPAPAPPSYNSGDVWTAAPDVKRAN